MGVCATLLAQELGQIQLSATEHRLIHAVVRHVSDALVPPTLVDVQRFLASLAMLGTTEHSWPIPPAPDRRVIQMHGLHQMGGGAEQLARMLHEPRLDLTAEDILTVLSTHAHTCLAFGKVLQRAQRGEPRGALLQPHGRALLAAAREAHARLGSFTPRRNLHVVHQAYEIHRCVAGNVPAGGPAHPPAIEAAEAFSEHTHAITTGITGLLIQGVHFSGQWVTIDPAAVALRWRLATRNDLPGLFDRLQNARNLSAPLEPAAPAPPSRELAIAMYISVWGSTP